MEERKRRHVSALETTITILETLQDREIAGVSELATALDMSKANVHKHLTTLHAHGFLTRDGEKYRLGLRFFELGTDARDNKHLYQEAAPKIAELAEVANQTATLFIQNGTTGVYVSTVDPENGDRTRDLNGERRPLHETASGRAVLSSYSKSERSKLLSGVVQSPVLCESLRKIDEQGVAVSRRPQSEGRQEIAAPVITDEEQPLGAVALIINDESLKGQQVDRNYRQLVKKTSTTLSKRMYLRSTDR